MRKLTLIALALCGLLGCGELINDPLRKGLVIGRVATDGEEPFVSALHQPERTVSTEADGWFEVELLAGPGELFARAGTAARRVPFTLGAGEILDLDTIELAPGLFVTFVFSAGGGGTLDDPKVDEIVGTELGDLRPMPEGTFEVAAGPLAAGCYSAIATASGRPEVVVPFCTSAGGERIGVVFPAPQ